LLIDHVKKERFGVGRKPRQPSAVAVQEEASSRHIPDAIKRKVYQRDGGRCIRVSTCSGPGRDALREATRQLDLLGQQTP